LNSKLRILFERLESGGILVKELPCWPTVDELRLAAHTVKHGEGESARQLRGERPQLFENPILRGLNLRAPSGPVSQPLAGDDIYVTDADLLRYRDALISFWQQLGAAILASQADG
jgi:hypothetical protein